MKLILTADVSGLGGPGDQVEVKDGYGRNYLLPRGLAILATRGAAKHVQSIRRAQDTRRVRDLDHAKEIKAALESLTVTLMAKAAPGSGKLFGSVTTADVVSAVRSAGGPLLDPHGAIKHWSEYDRGGHFAAMEVPDLLAADLREFCRPLPCFRQQPIGFVAGPQARARAGHAVGRDRRNSSTATGPKEMEASVTRRSIISTRHAGVILQQVVHSRYTGTDLLIPVPIRTLSTGCPQVLGALWLAGARHPQAVHICFPKAVC